MTAISEMLLPEEIVIAVLHRVGTGIRVIDDMHLAKIFNEAGEKFGGIFRTFIWDPQYQYSRVLTDAFQALDHGGSIQRENPASTYFSITKHTAGPYGASLFDKLTTDQRTAVEEIAAKIKDSFGGTNRT